MAEERIDTLVTPGKPEVVPHYLRASTGSCHDSCKYGGKHAFEEETRKSLRKRIAKPSSIEHIPVEIVEPKEKLVKNKPTADVKRHSLNLKHSPDIKSYPLKPKTLAAKSYSPKQNASSFDKNIFFKCRPSSSVKKPLSPDPPEIIKREILVQPRKVEVSLSKGSLTAKLPRSVKKADYQSEKQFSATSKPTKLKLSPSGNSDDMDGKGRKNGDAKIGKIKMAVYKSSSKKAMMPTPAPVSLKVSRISSKKAITSTPALVPLKVSQISSKKAMKPTPALLPLKVSRNKKVSPKTRKSGNLKLVSPKEKPKMADAKTSYDDNVSEKTLHVIEMETKNSSLETISYDHTDPSFPSPASPKSFFHIKSPSLSSQGKSNKGTNDRESNTYEFRSSDDESMENVKEEPLTEDHSKTLIKSKGIVSEDKHRSPVKLKFRSGKVVDVQSDNNNPRRLKFRKARVAGAGNGKADRNVKTFKKSRNDDDAADAEISTETVVLKHQDVQGKKDAQGLFNNVIEETASKLVESRKSKVKALVGAFETVISLQENKPSSHSVS